MKTKFISLAAAVLFAAFSFSACASSSVPAAENSSPAKSAEDSLQIVTTIFPEYDWVMNVLGDNPGGAEVTMLLDSGVDPHSYQPTAADILKISTCDLFIYVGGESDEWVEDALEEAVNEDMIVINLLKELGSLVKEEEMVEGMQESDHHHGDEEHDEEDHEHEDEHEDEEDHSHEHEEGETEYDEHVWLSLKNASALTHAVCRAVCQADPENAAVYESNTAAYTEKLDALDALYEESLSKAPVKTLLFGDRFPFRYLTDDYGLSYFAAFAGCSAETEASFETITFLSGKMDELSLRHVMTIEGSDHKIARTIIDNTRSKDQEILELDSLQSVTAGDAAEGTTYLSVMENNLEILKEALK